MSSTDCSFLKRWPVEILQISKIGEIAWKTLNISMSSCPIPIPFRWISGVRSTLQFIPYKRLDQTAPSWSAGQLKSSKLAKSAKLHRKTWISPWVLLQFRICFYRFQALDLLYNSFHTIVLIRELFPRAVVSWSSSISEIAMKNLNNLMSSCPIWINFDFLCSARSALNFVPYNRFDPRTLS